jgi:inner membrane protein involved in colicin E2 resistance
MSVVVEGRQSHTLRLLMLGALTVLLQVPVLMIAFLVVERADRRSAADSGA